jgi:uncharacterized protein (DUF4415 family)
MSASSVFDPRLTENGEPWVVIDVDLDLERQRPLTEAELAMLAATEGVEPDTSDIPELTEEQIARMVPFHLFRARKEAISVRIDKDILAWLRSQGPGYQTEINRILREHMLAQTQPTT